MVNMLTVQRLQLCIRRFEAVLMKWIGSQGCQQVPFDNLALDFSPGTDHDTPEGKTTNEWSLTEILKDGFLWTRPKSRRSLERRLTRKFGKTNIEKWATPRTNLIACLQCGQYHERGVICGSCYKKVKDETKLMMDAMGDRLKYDAPDKDTVYLYKDEEEDRTKYEGKFIVEMDKPRPKWFSDALMTKKTSKS